MRCRGAELGKPLCKRDRAVEEHEIEAFEKLYNRLRREALDADTKERSGTELYLLQPKSTPRVGRPAVRVAAVKRKQSASGTAGKPRNDPKTHKQQRRMVPEKKSKSVLSANRSTHSGLENNRNSKILRDTKQKDMAYQLSCLQDENQRLRTQYAETRYKIRTLCCPECRRKCGVE